MIGHIEITGAVLRLYVNPEAGDRDPPDMCLSIVGHERLAIVKGLVLPEKVPIGLFAAARTALKAAGFDRVLWTRYDRHGRKKRDFEQPI